MISFWSSFLFCVKSYIKWRHRDQYRRVQSFLGLVEIFDDGEADLLFIDGLSFSFMCDEFAKSEDF